MAMTKAARARTPKPQTTPPADVLALHLRAAGLPEPEREHRFHKPRRWRFDYAWPLRMLAVEVEGGIWTGGRHTRGKGYEKDIEKYNQATLDGWRLIRVTGGMIADGRALDTIQRALAG